MLVAFADIVKNEVLLNGNEIRLINVGTLKQKNVAARVCRNPRTGEPLQIAAKTSVAFTVASALKGHPTMIDTAAAKPDPATPVVK